MIVIYFGIQFEVDLNYISTCVHIYKHVYKRLGPILYLQRKWLLKRLQMNGYKWIGKYHTWNVLCAVFLFSALNENEKSVANQNQ